MDDVKCKLTLRDGKGLFHRATVVGTMSHGAGLPWLCVRAWVSLRPWIFSQLFFSTSVFSSPLTDKQAEEGSVKPVLLKRPVFLLVSGICLYFTLTIANLEFNARHKRQSPDLFIYMFLTSLPLKSVEGGRETPKRTDETDKFKSWCEITPKKQDLGHML